ncbi:MAG: AMP-binding protein, partial [Sinomicrobium sp.]|nr:AMP-binding protein [Sinomicrobium sp.]
DVETIAQNLREIRPTVGYAVPRVWEKFQSTIYIRMADAPWLNRKIFEWAVKIGTFYTEKKLAGIPLNAGLRIARFLVYWSVFYPLKYMVGMNRMRIGLSGAAPISPKVLKFYHMLGITMFEGYGMTETSALITVSKPAEYKLGTVGKPIKEAEVKLGEDGEILVRHPGVISGYYKDPEATAQALQDGWLHTGDVGKFDGDGFLQIVDRKKDLIITAGGKNIAPQKIENKLKVSPYINDAIVIGDRQKFLSAIIVLDEDNINKYARDKKIQYTAYSELANHPEIRQLIDREVQQVNKELARVETLRTYTILDKRLYVE